MSNYSIRKVMMRKEITFYFSFGFCKYFNSRHSQVSSKSIAHLKTEKSFSQEKYRRIFASVTVFIFPH